MRLACAILAKIMDEISYSGDRPAKKRKLSKRGIVFILFLIAILILVGGLVFFVSGKGPNLSKKTIKAEVSVTLAPTPTPSPTQKESPTPTISAKKSSLKVSVLNGSGEPGVAVGGATVLKDAGYSVVSTGNADNFDYKGITIQIKKSKKSFLSGLIADLSSKYNVSESDASSDLPEDKVFDVLVIVGK